MQLTGDMSEHLEQLIQKIKNGEGFGIIRPGDGEDMIINEKKFTAQMGDDWTNNKSVILKQQLIDSFNIVNPRLYIGIPCNTCCNAMFYNNYMENFRIPKSQLTYANIFCNSNWPRLIQFLKSYEKGFYLITSGEKECDFPIIEKLVIDKYLVNNWDTCWENETDRIEKYIKDKTNELICFASGPLSKIWIPRCMELNPNNTYLDIGSALDYFTKGPENARPYTDPNSHYSRECCSFYM